MYWLWLFKEPQKAPELFYQLNDGEIHLPSIGKRGSPRPALDGSVNSNRPFPPRRPTSFYIEPAPKPGRQAKFPDLAEHLRKEYIKKHKKDKGDGASGGSPRSGRSQKDKAREQLPKKTKRSSESLIPVFVDSLSVQTLQKVSFPYCQMPYKHLPFL